MQTGPYIVGDNEKAPSQEPILREKETPALKTADPLTTDEKAEEPQKEPRQFSVIEEKENATEAESASSTTQELLDAALDYCQTSNDFWEHGDLDNALDALDKAYALILKVNGDEEPEVFQQKEDLRFTISKRIIEVYSSRFTVANGNHKAIPLVMNAHVERELTSFSGRERKFFLDAYRRSGKYRPAIVQALQEAGLPEELSWLPLIESGYKVRALSRARALGMWQFIASTGYKFGLNRDNWIDERMDPAKSTQAAIAYLKELHQIFGDWTTVLAAYNCGEGAVLRRIKTQKINYLDNFWDLYTKLPSETASYVPRFLAVLHILNDPAAHGFSLPAVDEPVAAEEVTINKQVHLKAIAKRLGIPYPLLRDLNAELRKDLTPDWSYDLKVPEGRGDMLRAELSDIPVWQPPAPTYTVHKVRKGDSLSLIAGRYRTSIKAIMDVNGLKSSLLKVGWRLKIPTKEYYASTSGKKAAYALGPGEKLSQYVVKQGDSLYKIADRYNTTTKALTAINQLKSSRLGIGQVLMIPSVRATASPPPSTKKYSVRSGDSPYIIAKKHNMNLASFLELNKLTPHSTIFPGQILKVTVN
ncbi:MAG: LysM peptidoglycan-binding domain-containing protein [Desulfatiglandales bacterium]